MAKFYALTPDGVKSLRQERAHWKRALPLAIDLVLDTP